MEISPSPQVITFPDAGEWEEWLATHYTLQEGIFIKVARKSSGIISITTEQALDVALCYGWIDGIRKSLDEDYFLQKYTPRRKKSLWSKVNIEKVAKLTASGRMKEQGLTEIARAQADGRWDAAYESQKNATIPPDFAHAIENNKEANTFFASLSKANRYAFLWRLMTAKTPEKRTEQLEKIMEMLRTGKTFH